MAAWTLPASNRNTPSNHCPGRSSTALKFLRALPENVPLPEIAPEPDGSISLDWIDSRSRMFSLSIGGSYRLAFAWVDGADKGHGVVRFGGAAVPIRILEGIAAIMPDRHASLGVA